MTFEDRTAAVATFGFTPRQARFLTTVMLHSGVCLPRHYTKFAGIAFGHNTRDFFAKLTRERFATATLAGGVKGRTSISTTRASIGPSASLTIGTGDG